MACGDSKLLKNKLSLSILAKEENKRYRDENVSEKLVNCLECEIKPKAYRKIAIHYKKEHKSHKVMGFGCNFCSWECSESLGCFIHHMSQEHDLPVYMNTDLPLKTLKKFEARHNPICTFMKSKLVTDKKEALSKKNRAATVLRKSLISAEKAAAKTAKRATKKVPAKKGKKVIHAKVIVNTPAVHTESLMVEHSTSDTVDSLDEFFDTAAADLVAEESGSPVATNAISAEIIEKISNIPNRSIGSQDKTADLDEEVEYLCHEDFDEYMEYSSDEDEDDDIPIIPYEQTSAFLDEKKRLERKRKAVESDSDDDIVILTECKRK
jgi:hypothetical protein